MSKLQLSNVKKSFGAVEVIHGVDLEIVEGEFVVFVGPSGCGKSTMLRLLAGLETITSGELSIDGEVANEQAPVDRGVAMVFQSYALYPNMTVWQNLSFGLEQIKMPKAEIARRVQEVAELLKIVPLLKRRPNELSGGQSQRVAIGRAIVRDPKIFLFDEPLSNLDAELRVHMRVEIKALHARLKRTTVYVTHDQIEAMTMADRIVVFRDGIIEQIGSPLDLYNAPANKFVAGFIGSPQMNFFEAFHAASGGVSFERNSGKEILAGIRPEQLLICAKDQGFFNGDVKLVEQLGGETFVYLDVEIAQQQVVVKMAGQFGPRIGDVVGLTGSMDAIYVFDPATEVCTNVFNPHSDTTTSNDALELIE